MEYFASKFQVTDLQGNTAKRVYIALNAKRHHCVIFIKIFWYFG